MFNSYFTDQPQSLVSELINATGNYIFPRATIPHITPEQINDFINQIPVDKATGLDGVCLYGFSR